MHIDRRYATSRSERRRDEEFKERLVLLARRRPRYRYRMFHRKRLWDGEVINHRRAFGLCLEERLEVQREKRRQEAQAIRRPRIVPMQAKK